MVSIPIIQTLTSLITWALLWGGLLMLAALMAVESFGIPPLPSEVILPFAGFLAWNGSLPFWGAFAAALVGQVVGSYVAYAVGRWGRHYVVGPARWQLDPKHLAGIEGWFARRGEITVLVSRLLPVIRSYVSYPAGTAKMEPVRFGAFTAIGAAPFTLLLLTLGYELKAKWASIIPYFDILNYFAVAAIGVGVVYLVLRWRGKISTGFPPRLIRSSGPPRPAEDAPP